MPILKDYCDRQTYTFSFPHYSTKLGQTITPSETYKLERIDFYTRWHYADPGTCYVAVYETNEDGFPTSLITNEVAFTVTDSKILKSIIFSLQPTLQSGIKYAIVWTAPFGIQGSNELYLYGESTTGNYYLGGNRITYGWPDPQWYEVTTQDLNFYCYGSPAVPSKPVNPTPANDATEVDFSGFTLSWENGGGATSYDIYIGTSGGLTKVSSAQVGTNYITNIDEISYNQKIYWRVDAINDSGTTTGDVWNFDARPGKVTITQPETGITYTLDDTTGSWSAGTNASSYNVNFGLSPITMNVISEGQEGLEAIFFATNFNYNATYYWRVDSVNQFGVTEGDVEHFYTIVFAPPLPTGITLTDIPGGIPGDEEGGEGEQTGTATGGNIIITNRRLVVAAANKIWYESI